MPMGNSAFFFDKELLLTGCARELPLGSQRENNFVVILCLCGLDNTESHLAIAESPPVITR